MKNRKSVINRKRQLAKNCIIHNKDIKKAKKMIFRLKNNILKHETKISLNREMIRIINKNRYPSEKIEKLYENIKTMYVSRKKIFQIDFDQLTIKSSLYTNKKILINNIFINLNKKISILSVKNYNLYMVDSHTFLEYTSLKIKKLHADLSCDLKEAAQKMRELCRHPRKTK